MANQLNRAAAASVLNGRVDEAIVGANRRLSRKGNAIVGSLHGHHMVTVCDNRLTIDAALRTPNCRMAIADFLALLGHTATVSFAHKRFVVNINGRTYATDGNRIEVAL